MHWVPVTLGDPYTRGEALIIGVLCALVISEEQTFYIYDRHHEQVEERYFPYKQSKYARQAATDIAALLALHGLDAIAARSADRR